MKFGVGRIWHVSNTFARMETGLEAFRGCEWLLGKDLISRYAGTESVLGGILEAAAESGIQIEPLFALGAPGGGPISDAAAAGILQTIGSSLSQAMPLDGVILQLSGTSVARSDPEFDVTLSRALRDVSGSVPLALVLDARANVTRELAQTCEYMSITPPPPASNDAKVGRRALKRLQDVVGRHPKPGVVVHKFPLVIPVSALRADIPPLDHIWQPTSSLDTDDFALDISIAAGFQHADVPHSGASIIARGIGDQKLLDQAINIIASQLVEACRAVRVPARNPEEAIHDAMAAKNGSSIIVDLGDDPASGGPGDGTTLLWALIDLGVQDAVLASIVDPTAVAACIDAGVNSRVEIPVGGRRDTRHGYPIDVRGRIKTIRDGRFRLAGPRGRGLEVNAGSTVVLEVEARHYGHVDVILTERPVETCDLNLFQHLDIDPTKRGIIAVKSVADAQAVFADSATAIHLVLTPGITTPDPAAFRYEHIPRPMFPFDPI